MKKLFIVLMLVLTGLFLLSSCSGEKKAETQTQTQTKEMKKELNITVDMLTTDKDVVCGMKLTNESIADTAIYNGQLYGFCSSDCKAKFKENPDTFLSKMMEEGHEKGMEEGHEKEMKKGQEKGM